MELEPQSLLAPLPYEEWSETKTTLQLFTQIVGKLQLQYTRLRNHWWNITFRPTMRGLGTHLMHDGETFFEVAFDFIDHCVTVASNRTREPSRLSLRDGMSVAEFYTALFAIFRSMGLELRILALPYGQTVATPFAEDVQHHRYDAVLVRRWWEALLWTTDVLHEFALSYLGKQSEPQLFWHSFDLAVGRFSGRLSSAPVPSNRVMREAYLSEVIAFGFWAGDTTISEPSYYTYTAPEPPALTSFALRPKDAQWVVSGSGHLGLLSYENVRKSPNPRQTLLDFFASGFEAGTSTGQWNMSGLVRAVDPA